MSLFRSTTVVALSSRWFSIVLFGAVGTLLITGCKPPAKVRWVPPEAKQAASPDGQFREARLQMIDGKNKEAFAVLKKLDARTDLSQPFHNWVTLYAGLAALAAEKDDEARALFAKLVERGPFSTEGTNQKMADFFVDVGKRMSAEGPIPSSVSSNYDRFNYEALALYLYAIKDESVEDFEEALNFHRQFTTSSSKATEPFQGFNTHIFFARQSSTNVLKYEDLIDSVHRNIAGKEKTNDPEQVKKVVAEAEKAQAEVKRRGPLIASLNKKMSKLKGEATEVVKMSEEDEEEDNKVFPDAKTKWAALMKEYRFSDANQALSEPRLRTEKLKKEQDELIARTAFLEKFKFYLIQELTINGYAKPIKLTNGETASGVTKMDDKFVQIKTDSGTKAIPWAEIEPDSILEMAKSLVTDKEAPDAQGFRKWHLGNFAGFVGKTEEAKKLLNEAVKLNPSYEPDLPIAMAALK